MLAFMKGKTARAECMRCGKIHPKYRFNPGQIMYLLWCENCGTSIHKPVEGGLAANTPDVVCDKPVRFVEQRTPESVSTFCADGHHIKSRIYPTFEQAYAVMKRLRKWIEISEHNVRPKES